MYILPPYPPNCQQPGSQPGPPPIGVGEERQRGDGSPCRTPHTFPSGGLAAPHCAPAASALVSHSDWVSYMRSSKQMHALYCTVQCIEPELAVLTYTPPSITPLPMNLPLLPHLFPSPVPRASISPSCPSPSIPQANCWACRLGSAPTTGTASTSCRTRSSTTWACTTRGFRTPRRSPSTSTQTPLASCERQG